MKSLEGIRKRRYEVEVKEAAVRRVPAGSGFRPAIRAHRRARTAAWAGKPAAALGAGLLAAGGVRGPAAYGPDDDTASAL